MIKIAGAQPVEDPGYTSLLVLKQSTFGCVLFECFV